MKIRILLISGICFLAGACAPQAELVKTKTELSDLREDVSTSKVRIQELQKRLDTLEANTRGTMDVQKVMADYGAKSDQLAMDIQLLQGRLEENNFRIADLAQKLDDKTFKIAELTARIDDLESRLKSGVGSSSTGTPEQKTSGALEPSAVYRQAMSDYNSGNFDLALGGFQNYVTRFPDGSKADKAQYWVGESYYAKKEFKRAVDAFVHLIKTYPKSDKAIGAKLKVGYSYLNMHNGSKAKQWLRKVIREHPGTKEARLAKEKLRKRSK